MTDGAASLSQEIAGRAAAALGGVPAPVDRAARLHLLDALAVGALGSARGPVRSLAALAARAPDGPCSVIGLDRPVPAPVAALVNGGFIHSLEYDDTHVASVMHGSSLLAPAVLAVAEAAQCSGAAALRAYAVGWEVLIRFGLAAPGALQARGFQTTSAAGPFVAALVSALLDGDSQLAVQAMGIAGIQPGGTFAFLAGGDTVKAVQPGWAASAGLQAADLARAGVTGPRLVLDGEFGFFRLFAGDGGEPVQRMRRELATLGQRWHLPDAAFKLVPCCHFIHPFVEALQGLVDDGLDQRDIARIVCHVPTGEAPVIADPWPVRQAPAKPHDGRWSLPYVLAGQLTDGAVTVELFERPVTPEKIAVARLIEHEPWPGSGFPARFPARIGVELRDGTTMQAAVDDVLGGPSRPVGQAAVVAKARQNLRLAGVADAAAGQVLTELLERPDPDLHQVLRLLAVRAA
jgi:2-methylcitrate dehydratase PrpD